MVLMNCFHEEGQVQKVRVDDYKAGILAGEHYADLGHRKLFCVTGGGGVNSTQRLSGFRDSLGRRGISLPEAQVFQGDFEYASGVAAARHIMKTGIDVSGIWAQNDLMAIGAMSELSRSGVRIPDDISILGMDDSPITQYCYPRLTTLRQPIQQMAIKTVEILLDLRDRKNVEKIDAVFSPELIIRESTRRLA